MPSSAMIATPSSQAALLLIRSVNCLSSYSWRIGRTASGTNQWASVIMHETSSFKAHNKDTSRQLLASGLLLCRVFGYEHHAGSGVI